MSFIRESYCWRLWLTLLSVYDASGLHRVLAAAGRWCNRQIDESRLLDVLCREGAVSRSWETSLLCRWLTTAANLPVRLLHWLYRRLEGLLEKSFFAHLAFRMGEETAIAQSWLIALLWIIPYEYWNNAYTLMGFFLLLMLLLVRGMRSGKPLLDVPALGFWPVVFFGAICLGGTVFSAYPSLSGRFLLYHAACALCVLVTVSAVRHADDLKRLAGGAAMAVCVSSLYGILQRIRGVKVNPSYVDLKLNAGMPGRVFSFFDNPNTFAEFLILLLPLMVALVLCSRRLVSRAAALGVLTVGVVACGMTYSRASWVGLACAAVVFVFLWRPRLIPLFAVACVLCIPLLPQTIWNRILTITNFSDSSTSSRIPLYQAALATVRTSPISGAGLGTAAVQQFIADRGLYFGEAPYVHAHNIYLEMWVEAGVLGFVSFFGAMMWNIKTAARQVRHCADSAARTITAASASALCGGMVAGLADYLWAYPRVMSVFWFVFAMAVAGVKVCRMERAEN